MKKSRWWLGLILMETLQLALVLPVEGAKKVTMLIPPTLFRAMGGPKGIVADLRRERGLEVTAVVGGGRRGLLDRATRSLAKGKGEYDVIAFMGSWIHPEIVPYLEPLDEWAKKVPADYDLGDIIPSLVRRARFPKPEGTLYAIPYAIEAGTFYYRKDLFEQAGLSVPEKWGEFLKAAEKLHQPGKVYSVVQRGKPGTEVGRDFLAYLHSSGHGPMSEDLKQCLLDRPESIQILEAFATPFHRGWAPADMLTWGRNACLNAMAQGRAAMGLYASSHWGLLIDRARSKVGDRLGWFLVPTLDGRNVGTSLVNGWWMAMNKGSRNKKEAWALMVALSSRENQLRAGLDWANGPVRKSVYENPRYQEKFPAAKTWFKAVSLSAAGVQHSRAEEIRDVISKEVIHYMRRKKTAEWAMKDACQRIEALLR